MNIANHATLTAEEKTAAAVDGGPFEARLLLALADRGTPVENCERGKRAHALAGGSLVDILIRLGLCEEKVLAEAIAEISGLVLLSPTDFPKTPVRCGELSVPFLREARALPIEERDEFVRIAVVDPSDELLRRALEMAFKKKVRFEIGSASQIEDFIIRLHAPEDETSTDAQSATAGDVTNTDIARLRESAGEAPIVRFVERLIARAIDASASDIHIEPLARHLRVRIRVDGMLVEDEPAPLSSSPAIISRIKILARLDIAERRLPQDGSIKMNVRGREVDLRVATTPVVHGESVVIRILDRSAVGLNFAELGFDETVLKKLYHIFERPNGIFLVTGPTGSGKSTTLYAALEKLNKPLRKIVTVEDPVEYKIEGLNQIQVKPEIGLDFARTLRSILRHDPDVIMIGEIRDAETARIATQAALTGHLVLSTLHTNDAASSVTRLVDMGIEHYLVTSTVVGILAQRLVRILCADCKRPAAVPLILENLVRQRQESGLSADIFEAVGCKTCRGTGYRGRSVICELMILDDSLRQCVLKKSEAGDLRELAISRGMETLYQSGICAIFAGVTSYDEVMRVAQDVN